MINGDNAETIKDKLFFIIQSCKNKNNKITNRIDIIHYKINKKKLKNCFNFKNTPARNLCDTLLFSLNFKEIKKQFKDNLHFFDIGCGEGNYGKMLQEYAGNCFGSYTGLDIYKSLSFSPKFTHFLASAEKIKKYLSKKTNVIISQSSLEHIKNDFLVLNNATKELNANKRAFIQIHFVPACAGLWLYLWHGWRQYSYQRLALYSKRIKQKALVKTFLIPIGGTYSFLFQILFFTLPKFFCKIFPKFEKVNKKITSAFQNQYFLMLEKDIKITKTIPVFWAFIIMSKKLNEKKIFFQR